MGGWHGSSCWLLFLCVLCFVFCAASKQSSVLECHHTILYFEKWKLWAMFFGGFLRRSNYNRKNCDRKKRYSRLAVSWNKSQITICRLKRQTPTITGKNYNRKKGTVGWLLVGIHVKIWTPTRTGKNYDQKKRYSRLAYTICNTCNILWRNDLVAPLLYPWRERGQSRWRVGWHSSSCWLLCLCVLCFVFCAPTDDQTTVPFFQVVIFSSFVIIGVRILIRQTVIWDLFQPSARQLYLLFFWVIIYSGCNLNPPKNIAGQMTVPFFSGRNFFRS